MNSVTGNTMLSTMEGDIPIQTVVGTVHRVWNGVLFAKTRITEVEEASRIYTVHFSDGTKIEDDEFYATTNHAVNATHSISCGAYTRFPVLEDGSAESMEAQDLLVGDSLMPFRCNGLDSKTLTIVSVTSFEHNEPVRLFRCVEPETGYVLLNNILVVS